MILALGAACTNQKELDLGAEKRTDLIYNLAVYLDDRPENVSGDARFEAVHREHYQRIVQQNEVELVRLVAVEDTVYFLYKKRDRRSLYEHYRFMGGKFTSAELPNVDFLDIVFHTPRLAPNELERGEWLFDKMIAGKSLEAYWGDLRYLEWPDKDYTYNPQSRRWELRPDSKLNEVDYFKNKKAD